MRLSPKCLKEEELKTALLVYTIDRDRYISLRLEYDESANEHHLEIEEELYADLTLQGAPIIEGEAYFVGVLTEGEEGEVIPLFITEGVFGELHQNRDTCR